MKFTPDGQGEDGLLLCGFWEGDLFSSLEVFDVFDWLKKQFIRLRELYENAPPCQVASLQRIEWSISAVMRRHSAPFMPTRRVSESISSTQKL